MSHPLDAQNELERKIQLEGNADPDNFKMPDGRTLTEVRNDLQKVQAEEYKSQTQAATELARKQSFESNTKGGELIMDKTGVILDKGIQEPEKSEPAKPSTTDTPKAPVERSSPNHLFP